VIDAGGRGFHRGAVMVTELAESMQLLGKSDARDLVQRGQALGRQIAALPKPVISIARAGALGGGLELMLRSDFVYTLHDAQFSFPEVMLGFVAAWGGTQWAGRMMPFRRAQEMLLLGDKLNGQSAAEHGLVTRSFADAAELDTYVATVLERLRFCSPTSFAQTKACLAATWQGPLEYGERIELEAEATVMGERDFLRAYAAWRDGEAYDYHAGRAGKQAPPSIV
jgi:enoyl-CoA hydratase/carnithine racemase